MGVINLLYIGAAFAGLFKKWPSPYFWLLVTFVILRSAFLGSLENPEPRYTLELYPVLIVMSACLLCRAKSIQ
jgi:hypothetical protein